MKVVERKAQIAHVVVDEREGGEERDRRVEKTGGARAHVHQLRDVLDVAAAGAVDEMARDGGHCDKEPDDAGDREELESDTRERALGGGHEQNHKHNANDLAAKVKVAQLDAVVER
eukprot:Amastigsp_a177017_13.p7 type:complete len:116 gc:universal Amastigsp_a177017_13:1314-967(-)